MLAKIANYDNLYMGNLTAVFCTKKNRIEHLSLTLSEMLHPVTKVSQNFFLEYMLYSLFAMTHTLNLLMLFYSLFLR